MKVEEGSSIRRLYEDLFKAHGPQHWWPGDSAFEIMVGAVLTQNTAWTNVEKAIDRLKAAGMLALEPLLECPPGELAEVIRPAGYFNVKARRLHNLCAFVHADGGVEALQAMPTNELRNALLAVNGVGPETADDILLYAFGRPVFVVDAYTRRLGERLGILKGHEGYERIRHLFEQALGPDAAVFNELHALIVHHAKYFCRKRPLCAQCCLGGVCESGPVKTA